MNQVHIDDAQVKPTALSINQSSSALSRCILQCTVEEWHIVVMQSQKSGMQQQYKFVQSTSHSVKQRAVNQPSMGIMLPRSPLTVHRLIIPYGQ